mmetsp:Transcript_27926/g.71064  ORF Transcript_27926/g.71064 Transcript_27926/m.71064 type:complete len:277 (+) Transcript_27926:188-1018(+)
MAPWATAPAAAILDITVLIVLSSVLAEARVAATALAMTAPLVTARVLAILVTANPTAPSSVLAEAPAAATEVAAMVHQVMVLAAAILDTTAQTAPSSVLEEVLAVDMALVMKAHPALVPAPAREGTAEQTALLCLPFRSIVDSNFQRHTESTAVPLLCHLTAVCWLRAVRMRDIKAGVNAQYTRGAWQMHTCTRKHLVTMPPPKTSGLVPLLIYQAVERCLLWARSALIWKGTFLSSFDKRTGSTPLVSIYICRLEVQVSNSHATACRYRVTGSML